MTQHKRERRRNILIWTVWFIVFAGMFFALDLQSVPTGDDLGYMFADSAHHSGDGPRVESVRDITSTQASHYINCNGRFIIHWLTMFFLNIGGHVPFCIINSIIYFLVLTVFRKLSIPQREQRENLWSVPLFAFLLWFCVSQPGITWLSLVSYSTNYLWAAAANLWLLYYLTTGHSRKIGIYAAIAALLTGSLQESFSLPISCALLILQLFSWNDYRTDRKAFVFSYWLGTAICFFAPGNLNHANQGGGFAPEALLTKSGALLNAILHFTPTITVGALLLVIGFIVSKKTTLRFIQANSVLFWTVVFSLLLACVSFTSPRQLTCPSLISGILIIRLIISLFGHITSRRMLKYPYLGRCHTFMMTGILIIYGSIFGAVFCHREETSRCFRNIHAEARNHASVIVHDLNLRRERKHSNMILRMLDFDRLPVVFDGYTKRGLSRLYNGADNPSHLTTALPAPPRMINERGASSEVRGNLIMTAPLVPGYRCARIPRGLAVSNMRDINGNAVRFERVKYHSNVLIVIPDTPLTEVITFNRQNPD